MAEESPEAKALKDALADRTNGLKKLKNSYERFRREAEEARASVPSIEKKGYPATFCDRLSDAIAKYEGDVKMAAEAYALEVIKKVSAIDECQADTDHINAKLSQVEA